MAHLASRIGPFRQLLPDIVNAQYDLAPAQPTAWPRIAERITAECGNNEAGLKANLEVARQMHEYAVGEQVAARKHHVPPLRLGTSREFEVSYWWPFVLAIGGQLVVPFLDPRRAHGLTQTGRRFAFSMMHEGIRVADPDLAGADLRIFQFEAVGVVRCLRIHYVDGVLLFTQEELETMVAETYAEWEAIRSGRPPEPPRRAGGDRQGDLF